MASFTALNIEPAEDVPEEVDDTKEIQIEEALKLYQNALKLHSQGPDFYPQAREAYAALLESDIFKYPESISDYLRSTLPDADVDDAAADALAEIDVNDAAASALPQTIYLSYKNNGQFHLDVLKETLRSNSGAPSTVAKESQAALKMFAEALERDDTDLDLWRKAARLGGALNSYRLARYCSESVLVGDDNEVEVRTEQLGLDEAFSSEELQGLLRAIIDDLSTLQAPPSKKPRKALLRFARSHIQDPYPYLPGLPKEISKTSLSTKSWSAHLTNRHMIVSADRTWYAIGKAILGLIRAEVQKPGNSTFIGISLPLREESPQSPAHRSLPILPKDVEMLETSVDPLTREEAPEVPAPVPTLETVDDQSSIDRRAESQLRESLEGIYKPPVDGLKSAESHIAEDVECKSLNPNPRKRSSASVGNDEMVDGGRTKSRRTRARESNAESLLQTEDASLDQRYYDDRLEDYSHADQWMFGTVGGILSKIGVEDLGTIDELKHQVCESINKLRPAIDIQPPAKSPDMILANDLRSALATWDDEKARSAMQGDSSTALQDLRGMNRSGLAIFLEHSRKSAQKPSKDDLLGGGCGLDEFVEEINAGLIHYHEVAFTWLCKILQPMEKKSDSVFNGLLSESLYISSPWPEELKETVVQLIIQEDVYFYERMSTIICELEQDILGHASTSEDPFIYTAAHYAQMEMTQTLHELHLDVYALINNPNSEVDQATRISQRDRLMRWGMLAQTAVRLFMDHGLEGDYRTKIALRHLWSTTFHSNMAEDATREHILLCLHDLKQVLTSFDEPAIVLINNAIMPEISVSALDQEISRLNSMDFFMKIFGSEKEDSVSLIESIEPILDPSSVEFIQEDIISGPDDGVSTPSHFQELASFLDRGDATLRLFLWRRLQDAYRDIDYLPKVISCQLRSIEAVVKEIRGNSFLESANDTRPLILLRWLKSLNNILIKLLPELIEKPSTAFECIDLEHLRSSMVAVAHISRLLHTFTLYEDMVRVGLRPAFELRGTLGKSLESFKDKLRDMQVRCWVLQYTLVKEYMSQEKEMFDTPSDDRIQFLRAVHSALGVRSACKYADKILLKLMKSELFSTETNEDCELDIAQVLFDLHGFKFSNQIATSDHGCPIEKLDSRSAAMMVDFVLMQVDRLNIKDLSKSELKTTIERVQQAIGTTRHPTLAFNRRIINGYLKSPINPSELFRLVQGVGGLALTPVPVPTSENARKGWYFLLGHASLTKFRTQKRLIPAPTNDLDDAITYFRQDLEYATERWETWYRLAQTYDSKLEDEITWSSDKINNNKSDLASLQRNAIHCYAMAVVGALRAGDEDEKSRAVISELFTDYGIRLYASSRQPLDMAAFSVNEFQRHYSDFASQKLYTGKPFKEMRLYSVWGLASNLFRRAMVDRPNYWVNHYMLSKCRWKMFNSDEAMRGSNKAVTLDGVLDPLLDAIETLPTRKEKGADPIFEPHFRLVSVLHKLVTRQQIEPIKAGEILSESPYAKKLSPPQDMASWKPYVLDVLKCLKNADKSNWHHRIMLRIAKIHYDSQEDAISAANAAKNELMPQIFTKTMALQVWRPEFERPGRHFVYTTRYVYFFVKLLDQIGDRSSLEQLLRRLRKKQGDFINHAKLWEDMCMVYAKLIRSAGAIPEHHEDGIFKPLSWDDFVANSARLDNLKDLPTTNGPTLDLLREAFELKKLNNNLMKVTMFEDLIADMYARLYEESKHRFIEQVNEENRERMKVDHLLMNTDGAADDPTPPTSAPASEAPAPPRGRTKGIARRDIQKRAEAIVNRFARPSTTKAAAAPAEEEKVPPAPPPAAALSHLRDDAAEGASAAQSSAPASVHDSADESELSEMDDDKLDKLKVDQRAIFPNLNSLKSVEQNSEMSAPASINEYGDEAVDDTNDNAQERVGSNVEGDAGLAIEEGEETELQADMEEDEIIENNTGEGDGGQEDIDMDGDAEEGGEAEGEEITEDVGDETMAEADDVQAEGEALPQTDVKAEEPAMEVEPAA
ncbi:putative transcriptional corepressor of histone genes [Talaromyces proteolyticus]|uniref:Histone transcription regulator 3 homolog n=1 Tax=Talaromyces proteolyticus TaxID=1131652 RepID=A0AAD4KTC7_9EURO|nr:putative transcriptional corepressor of histone genes [Talaromyces proteolyticus]KAH8695495.1 putative transcriptional corepressor of histone genes [Talaromyces proteolyticus]